MYKDLTYSIIGGLMEVHNTLKNIWPEKTYEDAVESELWHRGLKVERQKEFEVSYFGENVGWYYLDLLVEDKVIIELKCASKIIGRHKAQLLSYMKGYNKPLGILANFGEKSLTHFTFPNKMGATPLEDCFDFEKVRIEGREDIRDLLIMANRVLVTLGCGYLAQVYRRALRHELRTAGIRYRTEKKMYPPPCRGRKLEPKDVNFFAVGDLLLAVVAVKELDDEILFKFWNHVRYLNLRRGLIFNFNALQLDFRYYSDVRRG